VNTAAAIVLICVLVVAAVILYRRRARTSTGGSSLEPLAHGPLDWRPVPTGSSQATSAVELWWRSTSLISVERLDERDLPASVSVPGALGELVSRLLDDETVRQLLSGERFALVRLPPGSRARDLVKTADGRTVPIVRGGSGKFGRLGTVVRGTGTGAGVGAVVATAPAVAAAVGAAWAHQQLASTMIAMREGMERIAVRLDDSDHGVLAAAQAHLTSLSGLPSTWSDFDRDALAQHRVMLDGVYHTAKRRADRRFAQLQASDEVPRLDPAEVSEIQRDFVLRVDAELVSGQMALVQAVAMIESDPDAALSELAEVENELAVSLKKLAGRMSDAIELGLPGRHRLGARKNARQLQAEVATTLGGLRELLSDLSGDENIELLVGMRNGELELRSFEPPALGTGAAVVLDASNQEPATGVEDAE
jgi:hypothetical protein